LVPLLGSEVVYKGWVPRPKAGYLMFGPKFGSKDLVLRLGFEVGSRDRVHSMDLNDGSQGCVSRLSLKGESDVLAPRLSPKIGSPPPPAIS
jgi:hypothetical protein